MTAHRPPRLAVWLLEHAGLADEALVGDLTEAFEFGRSNVWFWRQTVIAIVIGVVHEIRRRKLASATAAFGSLIAISLSTYAGSQLTTFAGRWTWTGGAESWQDLSAGLLYRVPFLLAMSVGGSLGGWLVVRLDRRRPLALVLAFAFLPLCAALLSIVRLPAAAAGPGHAAVLNLLFGAASFMALTAGALVSGLVSHGNLRDPRR